MYAGGSRGRPASRLSGLCRHEAGRGRTALFIVRKDFAEGGVVVPGPAPAEVGAGYQAPPGRLWMISGWSRLVYVSQ